MKRAAFNAILGSLLLLACSWPSVGKAAKDRGGKSASYQVDFRDDDIRTQRLARKLLAEIGQGEDNPSGANWLRTAWVSVSYAKAPDLFVMYGCSPTGNCGLYGFERARSGWRLVLDSLAQRCSILPSSHGARRDISAYMHGGATQGTIKTYQWRKNRYVRVSERVVIYR